MPTGTEVIVRVGMVDCCRVIEIEGRRLVQRMSPRSRKHIRGVVWICSPRRVVLSGIAGSLARVRPSEADIVRVGQNLRQRQPGRAVTSTLILVLQVCRNISLGPFPQRVHGGLRREGVLATDLERTLVADVGWVEIGNIAGAIDVLVHFVRKREVQRTRQIGAADAVEVTERAVVAGWRKGTAAGDVATCAVRLPGWNNAAGVVPV